MDRLQNSFNASQINDIEQEFRALKCNIENDVALKQTVERNARSRSNFQECWKVPALQSKYMALREYCAGLATVLPGTCQVESDFSILKGAKTAHRTRMLDLSLEGCMHSKQYFTLERVRVV
jgi:hypothetical protein